MTDWNQPFLRHRRPWKPERLADVRAHTRCGTL